MLSAAVTSAIITGAKELGASVAGVAAVAALRAAPSYQVPGMPYELPASGSLIVLGLRHPPGEPALDYWRPGPGGTEGNIALQRSCREIVRYLREEHGLRARTLPYHVERGGAPHGGVYLKDAAVLAGLGCVGRNNLFLAECGPVRLRAVWLDAHLAPSERSDFDPCSTCEGMPCRSSCPQDAFRSGRYDRAACDVRMKLDEGDASQDVGLAGEPVSCVKYCRLCECPMGW